MVSRQIHFDFVAARTIKNGITLKNGIPWKLPSDLKMFKK